MKKLGVIGGLGPMATAFFMQMVIEMTDATVDQEHIEMLIHSCPGIPDRTKYILGQSLESPVGQMASIGKNLVANGAQVIAIPCITANYFYKELSESIPARLINPIEETAKYLKDEEINTVGLMATDGTVESKLFNYELESKGINLILPGDKSQSYVMDIIYRNIKAGTPVDMDKFSYVSEELREKGSKVILLGCTELSMVRRDEEVGSGYLDVMELLAKTSVEACGKLKNQYISLITK